MTYVPHTIPTAAECEDCQSGIRTVIQNNGGVSPCALSEYTLDFNLEINSFEN